MNTISKNGRFTKAVSNETWLIGTVTKVVSAYVRGNALPAAELANLVGLVRQSIEDIGRHEDLVITSRKPSSADIIKSVQPDYIVSFLDGKPYKTLKRHLTCNDLTPAQYRTRFGLPDDYPMVSSAYASLRAQIARTTGLGQRAA